MHRTKIDWTQFSWNPLVGCALGCRYCYARGQAKRQKHRCNLCYSFTPHLHAHRLEEPANRRKPSLIFADSMAEWWDKSVSRTWLDLCFAAMRQAPQHIFQVLTKQPQNMLYPHLGYIPKELWPENVWVGVSIEGTEWWRVTALAKADVPHRFLSLEPFLRMPSNLIALHDAPIEWVIVGGLTKGRKVVRGVPYNWFNDVLTACRRLEIPLFVKRNAGLPGAPMEFPKEMKQLLQGS